MVINWILLDTGLLIEDCEGCLYTRVTFAELNLLSLEGTGEGL
jgi:hypothetical protein